MNKFSNLKINEQEITLAGKEDKKEDIKTDVENRSESGDVSTPIKFFSKLFEARQMAHIFHLQVKGEMGSGWEHTALNTFYDQILELTDEIIEVYQGQFGVIEGYEIVSSSNSGKKSLDYLNEFVKYIKDERYKCIKEEETHLHNIIDEVIALCYKTIYKLTNLK